MKPAQQLFTAPSLAAQISRSLIVAVSAVWLAGTVLVAWYVDREIQHNFDEELIESTHRQLYPALLDLQLHPQTQQGLEVNPLVMQDLPGDNSTEPLLLQLRNPQGHVLLRTAATPASPFAVPLQAGFFDTPDYRVFSLYDSQHQVWLQLADPLEERQAASQRTLWGLVGVLLLILPILAWLIQWVARHQLRNVHTLQQQITARSGSNLQPLQLQHLPRELQAVADGVNQLLERLGEALNAERSLAANAAHELRTPLAEVRLRLHTAIDQARSHDRDVPLADVQASLQSLETLSHRTERLLQLSRAEGGDQAHFQTVDLVQLAEQMAQSFWAQSQAAQKRLDCLPPQSHAPVLMHGDIDSLAIVLRNLIDNALHHTQAAIELEVRATPCPTLIVRDHGAGLSTEQLTHIQQRHARIASQHIGYGLGMSIVRTIADKHGAQLRLASPPPGCLHGLEIRLEFAADQPSAYQAV